VARHIPRVWDTTTPEAAHAARAEGCVAALRRIRCEAVETPELARAAELLATGRSRRAEPRADLGPFEARRRSAPSPSTGRIRVGQ